jgi:hypothetical protein
LFEPARGPDDFRAAIDRPRQRDIEEKAFLDIPSVSPAPQITKGGSSEFRCFFCEEAKKDSRNSSCAGPREEARPAFAIRAFSRAILPSYVAIKRLKQRKETT